MTGFQCRRGAALAAALALLAPLPALAWDSFSYPLAGFAIQFPAQPAISQGVYRTHAGLDLPAAIYAAQDHGATYSLTIADFSSTVVEGEAAISDAVAKASERGEVVVDVQARINTQYGHELSIRGQDGERSVLAIFFIGKKLYVLDARAPPPDALAATGSLIRFQQSLQFTE